MKIKMISSMIGVVGGGSWATALVKVLLEKAGVQVMWWVRSSEAADAINASGRNPRHLRDVVLDRGRVVATTDLASVVSRCEVLLVAVPSVCVHEVFSGLPQGCMKGSVVASAVKGYLPETGRSVTSFFVDCMGVEAGNVCVVSGPSHAEEVACGQCTFLEVASPSRATALKVADALRCGYIHVEVSDRVSTLELCGLAKNVYAVAAGMLAGLGHGDNLTAVLVAAAAKEMCGLHGDAMSSFATLGDLAVTCFSRHSRNRRLGEAVACGRAAGGFSAEGGMVAEGYYASLVLHGLAAGAGMPVAEAVYRVLHCGASAEREMNGLIDNVF